MKKIALKLAARLSRLLAPGMILILTLVLSGLIAGLTTLRSSRDTVERYVSVWEEEVARNLLLKGDTELYEKIRIQILDLASDVSVTGPEAQARAANHECFAEQNLNVTLYGTPAGELKICRSPEKLLLRSLTSPVFAFGLLIGLLLLVWQIRRTNRDEAARALTELAVRVAHDIRAPLMALKIAASEHESKSAESRSLIEAATLRISAIADDLLKRSRADASGSVPAPSPLQTTLEEKSLQAAIQEIIREKAMTSPSDILFDVRPPNILPGVTQTLSSHDFERVLSNLLQNAIEAAVLKNDPHSKPRITVETLEAESEVAVTIRDNGVGIPKDVLPRIGDVGFSYGKQGGNGVGLSSARRWAEARGGSLDIRSLEGTGTEVRVTLPRQQTPAALR